MATMSPQPSYLGVRHDMLRMVPEVAIDRVLDVGCAEGATVRALRAMHPEIVAEGLEVDPRSAAAARAHLDRVLEGDASTLLPRLVHEGATYDLVLLGDVLEHLVDPWNALECVRRLCPQGHVVVSLPNVAHLSTLLSLIEGRWPYRERGIHDRTHLRWFGIENLHSLFADAGFQEIRREANHRIIEVPHRLNERLEPWLRRIPGLRRFTAYQFVSLLAPAPEVTRP